MLFRSVERDKGDDQRHQLRGEGGRVERREASAVTAIGLGVGARLAFCIAMPRDETNDWNLDFAIQQSFIYSRLIIPRRIAAVAASVRSLTFNFSKTWLTCNFTVTSAISRAPAISLLPIPRATMRWHTTRASCGEVPGESVQPVK